VVSQFNKFDSRIRLFKMEENTGPPALNSLAAFGLITGGWIAWQFDDCVWGSNHLAHLLNAAENSPTSGIVYGQARVILKDGSTIIGENFDKLKLSTSNFIPNCSTLIKYQVLNEVGWVFPHILLKRNNDHDFWIRASKKFDFTFVEEVIATEYGPSLENSI
jgi:GT2 family glycosyltransferase